MTVQDLLYAKDIDQVVHILDGIVKETRKKQSRLGYFAVLYQRVTIEVRDKIEAGYFEDNERMERLDVMFANRYFRAYQEYTSGLECNASWRVAFEAAERWGPLVIQHLFAGMNAHIGLDLGIAAVEVQGREYLEGIRNDFNKINQILSDLTDEVQEEISVLFPPMKIIDKWAGRLDEKLADFAMSIARDKAWEFAEAYAKVDGFEPKHYFILDRDKVVADFGAKLVKPGVLFSIILFFFRFFEKGSIAYKLDVLSKKR